MQRARGGNHAKLARSRRRLCRPTHTLTSMMPFTISANFDHDVGWRAAEITPSLRDREGAYADLRLVYISVVPLALALGTVLPLHLRGEVEHAVEWD